MGLGSAVGAIGSAVIGSITSSANMKKQQEYDEINRKQNFEYNEKAADNADARQRAQYADLYSPQAQMEQYAAAGLSPSMMMGGGQSAVGGTPSGAMGSLNGPYPTFKGYNPQEWANVANIMADTKLKEAQTMNMTADTEFTMTNILKAAEETENYKQRNMLLKLDREKIQLEIDLQKATNPEEIKQCLERTQQMYETTEQLRKENKSLDLRNELDEKTMQTRIDQAAQEYKTELAETALKWANVNVSQQQVQTLIDSISISRANSTTERLSMENERRKINEQVAQWAKQNGFTEQQLKQENTKNWLNFATNVFGSVCNLAGSIGSAALKAK